MNGYGLLALMVLLVLAALYFTDDDDDMPGPRRSAARGREW